jgi:hypothetical protein
MPATINARDHHSRQTDAPAVPATCSTCGAVTAPDGVCLEIGACERADSLATRRASGETVKSRLEPAAWRASGSTD